MKRFAIALCLCLAPILLGPRAVGAVHHITVAEVLERLNRDDIKTRIGIHRAYVQRKLKRHLVIEVSNKWYSLSRQDREMLAKVWLQMWREAKRDGILSVVDAESHKAVLNFTPACRVSLTDLRRGG